MQFYIQNLKCPNFQAKNLNKLSSLLEFILQYSKNFIDRFFFEVSSFDQFRPGKTQYVFSRIATNRLQLVDYPAFNFIREFIQINIFIVLSNFAVNIYFVTGQLAG